ncbi:hypothetical protein [Nonomuraea sp. 10N515B]|uniref:hypothetical protein n=1 Tax=Nonomuraea sp. 10N515B TaxID=3457422 RepID=UPI003FCEADEE
MTLDQVFREQWGRVLATLIGFLGDFDLAEEAAQEAFAIAEAGLRLVAHLGLDDFRYLHSTRAELLRRLGRTDEARDAYRRAGELTDDGAERRFLERRLTELAAGTRSG